MPGPHVNKRKPGYQAERSLRQQARILEALTDSPMTSYQLTARLHMARKTLHVHLGRLMAKPGRRVYICGYDMARGRPKHVFDIGSHHHVSVATHQLKRLLAEVENAAEPISVAQAAERISIGISTARHYFRTLRAKHKIRVAKWVWVGTSPLALYVAGEGEDAPKPTTRPAVTRSKRVLVKASPFAALGI